MFGAGAVVTISTLESKISRSQQEGTTAYYVAEAGIKDALWRINTTSAYSTAILNGTLNVTYSASNVPASGQGFTVTMMTDATKGAGYATVDVTGTSNNGTFIAKRRIKTNVFQGSSSSSIGQNAFFGGGALSITNGSSSLQFSNGGLYSSGAVSINNATVNLGSFEINAVGSYSANPSSTVTAGAIHSSNNPPAPSNISTPSFDFTYYSTHYNTRYTNTQFQNLFCSSCGSTVTLPGPVTYVTGAVSLPNSARNKTLNVTGMLIINGNFTINGAVSNFRGNFTDPGNGKSGLFIRSNGSFSNGTWNINGVLYASGSLSLSVGSSQSMTVNGAIVAGGATSINTGLSTTWTYNNTRATATLGAGAPSSVEVQHWEEEY